MATKRLSTFTALAGGTLVIGSLDITYAMLFWTFRGVGPTRVLQSVAAGLIGREAAVSGGMKTALLGLALHYFISFSIVLVYWIGAKLMPVLRRHAVICGATYGVLVYIVMNYVVIPLSMTHNGPFNLLWVACSVIVHAFLIGMPAALFAKAALPETAS
ncbi:MAG TPA: hypothetical protein VLC46_00755 [Thermoanaerobaculia bacterium]|jgi:uncharacterized membrane protein YagU involved in acid resistance|nr:hypothetical protein [Thermoanaerobaculia bacterium]